MQIKWLKHNAQQTWAQSSIPWLLLQSVSIKIYHHDVCVCQLFKLKECGGHRLIAYYRLKLKFSVKLFFIIFQWLNAEPNFWDIVDMQFKRILSSSKLQRYSIPHSLFIISAQGLICKAICMQMSDSANYCVFYLMSEQSEQVFRRRE